MIRLALVLTAVVALATACSGGDEAAGPPATSSASAPTPPTTTEESPGKLRPPPKPLRVRVVDGDTRKRVRGALVRFGKKGRAHADRHGVARLQLGKHRRVAFRVTKHGYLSAKGRARTGRGGRRVRVEIYRRVSQWPMYGANPARTQAKKGIRLRPPFRRVWSTSVGSLLEFPAVVWKGVAYADSMQGYTTAISMRNGKILWRRKVGTLLAASPGLSPERNELVVPTMSPGDVAVLDMGTGRVKYRRSTGRTEPSPVVHDEVAYFGAANGNVYALDLRRRRFKWVKSVGVKITSSAALVGKRLYFGDYAGRVFCVSTRTGRTIWVGSAGSRVYGTVAVADGKVFAPSVFSGLSALSARNGRLLWRNGAGGYLYSAPAYYHGRVYYGSYTGAVTSADADTGRVHWVSDAGRAVSGAVQVVAGIVYAGSFDHRITAWDWRSGKRLWTFPHGKYVAVSGNAGRLLLHGVRRLYAVVPKRKRHGKHHEHAKHHHRHEKKKP